jgi:hypothetical protein
MVGETHPILYATNLGDPINKDLSFVFTISGRQEEI